MKKYFKNVTIFTLDELKTIVANNPQLGFYNEEIICEITGRICIHNRNGEYMGHNRIDFRLQEDGNWKMN